MSEPTLLSDIIRALPTIADASNLLSLLVNSNGELVGKKSALPLNIGIRVANGNGAFITANGMNLVMVVDTADKSNVMLYLAYKEKDKAPVNTVLISKKNLTTGATNSMGTVVVLGGNSTSEEIIQVCLTIPL